MNDNVDMKLCLFGVIVENEDEVRQQFNLRFGNGTNLWNLFCAALSSEWAAYNSKKGPKDGSVTIEEIKHMSISDKLQVCTELYKCMVSFTVKQGVMTIKIEENSPDNPDSAHLRV